MKTKNSAAIVTVEGTRINFDHRPSLTEAQEVVGGYIELLKARSSKTGGLVTLVLNEEGKPKHLSVNKSITEEFGQSIYNGYIVGNVIILTGWRTLGCD